MPDKSLITLGDFYSDRIPTCYNYFATHAIVRGDVKIHNCWLQPKYCSIQWLCIAFPIYIGCSWLLNMRSAANAF